MSFSSMSWMSSCASFEATILVLMNLLIVAAQFLQNLIAAIPDTVHTVLTDHGIQFTNRKRDLYAL